MHKDELLRQYTSELQLFIEQKDSINSKLFLESLPDTLKGKVFEEFIAELYRGNGWIAEVKGGRNDKGADILIRHPKEPTTVQFILQAKNHLSPITQKDTQSELNQFITEASPKFKCKQYRIIATNGFVADAFKFQRYNLRLESWKHIETLINNFGKTEKEEPEIGLHAHNITAYENLKELWKSHNRVAVIQATGTGKSYIIFKALSDFFGKKKILLTPSKAIQNQFIDNTDFSWLIDKNTQTFLYHNNKKFDENHIHELKAELIVLDEFHRIGAKKFEKKIQRLLEINPDAFVIGTTATPIRYLDGKRDMCEELFSGVKASNITLSQAIATNVLPNPTYITSLISLQDDTEYYFAEILKSKRSDEEKKTLREEVEKIKLNWEKSCGVPDVLKKHLHGLNLKKFIVFCEGVDHLDEMKVEVESWFQKAGFRNRQKFEIFAKLGEAKNKTTIQQFKDFNEKDTIVLLFAIDMLNEGVHISDVDGVILLRPTESPIVFYQQLGRCLQVGNQSPVIFDFVRNFNSIKAINFRAALEEAKENERRQREEDGVADDTPIFKITDETKDIIELFDEIDQRLDIWEINFQLLLEYKNEKGHCTPQFKEKFKGVNIGYWTNEQRRKQKQYEKVSPQKIEKLNSVGFDWREEFKIENNSFEFLLNEKLEWLANYYTIHKTSVLPYREPKDEKKRIGWTKELANFTKIIYKSTYKKRVEAEPDKYKFTFQGEEMRVIDFLNKIEFDKNRRSQGAESMIEKLKEEHLKNPKFNKEDFNHLIASDKAFSNHVNRMRNHMNDLKEYPKSYFLPGQIEELLSLGFVQSRKHITWDDRYNEIKILFDTKGSCKLKQSDNFGLYQWCKEQLYFENHLTPEQREALNKLKFFETWVVNNEVTPREQTLENKFRNNVDMMVKHFEATGSFRDKKRSKIENFIERILRYGVSLERQAYLKSKGFDVEEQRKNVTRRGRRNN